MDYTSTIDVAEIKWKMEREIAELKKCGAQYEDDEFCNKLSDKYATAFNKLGIEILHTPMLPKKPINPFVASAIGNSLGGLALGVTAGMSAIEKTKYTIRYLRSFNQLKEELMVH